MYESMYEDFWRFAMMGSRVRELFLSLDLLEKSIESTKAELAKRNPIPLELMRRVSGYEEVLLKQRKLAKDLCRSIRDQDFDSVGRMIRLLNGYSQFVLDDVKDLIQVDRTGTSLPGEGQEQLLS